VTWIVITVYTSMFHILQSICECGRVHVKARVNLSVYECYFVIFYASC